PKVPTCRALPTVSMDPAHKARDVGFGMKCQQTLKKNYDSLMSQAKMQRAQYTNFRLFASIKIQIFKNL
ncbi:hypothetical protein, partial [Legionella pneumophila]|uniref:hypothetical protein n=1 Tax=Legionella pneumophila TaxID=446 RepID=UPI000AFB517C